MRYGFWPHTVCQLYFALLSFYQAYGFDFSVDTGQDDAGRIYMFVIVANVNTYGVIFQHMWIVQFYLTCNIDAAIREPCTDPHLYLHGVVTCLLYLRYFISQGICTLPTLIPVYCAELVYDASSCAAT